MSTILNLKQGTWERLIASRKNEKALGMVDMYPHVEDGFFLPYRELVLDPHDPIPEYVVVTSDVRVAGNLEPELKTTWKVEPYDDWTVKLTRHKEHISEENWTRS